MKEPETCPVCGERVNHVVKNGYRNMWTEPWVPVCTPEDSDWMYVHSPE